MNSLLSDKLVPVMTALRRGLAVVLVFSLIINIMMLATPLYMLQVYDRVLTSYSVETLSMLTLIVIITLSFMFLLEWVRNSLLVRLGSWLDRQLSGDLITASIRASSRDKNVSAEQCLRDLAALRGTLTGPSILPMMDIIWSPIYIILIFILHPVLGWLSLGGAAALLVVAIVNEKATRQLLNSSSLISIKAMANIGSTTRNADAVQAMGLLPNVLKRWDEEQKAALSFHTKAQARSGVFVAVSKFLRMLIQVLVIGIGAHIVIAGEMTAGSIIAASILAARALAPIEQIINSWRSAIEARSAYQRIHDLMESTSARNAFTRLPVPRGEVTAEHLIIGYRVIGKPLLKNVNFVIRPGEMVGLIGASGSGKSTLARVLLGSLQPLSGHARLDGMDVLQWDSADRGKYVGYLPQHVELFNGTVSQNISRMGRSEPENIVKAAQFAGVHDTIVRMPQGYDTEVGDSGFRLSGGERQQVALARALFGSPQFLILDEPDASLDKDGEFALLNCLKKINSQKITTIVISHRPAVLECVDKIMFLSQGGVKAFDSTDKVLLGLKKTELNSSHFNGAPPNRYA